MIKLCRLQQIWDEVGESDNVKVTMLLQFEQECLDVYNRKVDRAAKLRKTLEELESAAKLVALSGFNKALIA
ncbi:hypothetical protein FRX31_010115, partial [Thalictrum thalictroides]